MRKIFLIPLLTLMCSVMAWGADVARIGDTNYTSFNTALGAARDGQTVVLLANIAKASSTANELRTVSYNITIDGQGQYSVSRAFQVSANKTLTLKDVTVNNGIKCSPAGAIILNNGATVVLDNAEIAPAVAAVLPVRTVDGASGTIQLVSGTTNIIRNNAGTALYTYKNGVLTISGEGNLTVYHTGTTGYALSANAAYGSFLVSAPNVTFIPSDITRFIGANAKLADGYLALYENGAYKVLPTSDSRVAAGINGYAYSTLAAAVEAAQTGDVVTLWANAAAVSVAKAITVDANGYDASAITAASGYARVAIDGGYAFGKVNKEGNVYTVSTFDEFLFAANYAAVNGDIIRFANDIAYDTNGKGLINITKSITLDGQGHKLGGWGTANISVSGTENWPVTLAVNYQGSASAALDVTIQNLHVSNEAGGTRSYGLMAWDGVDKLTLKNDSIYLGKSTASYKQVICFTGTDATPINLKIEDSFIGTATGSGYPAYILKPINATFKNTKFSGYCALYFKYRATGAYGTVVGSRGSVINADNCNFDAPNIHSGYSNDFAVFAFEDDGITLNLNNCGMNAEMLGNAGQTMVSASEYATRREQDITINISGDNSYINGDFVNYGWTFKYDTAGGNSGAEIFENGYWQKWNSTKKEYDKTGYDAGLAFTPATGKVKINITGGTYALNPGTYKFNGHVSSAEDISEFVQEGLTIPDGYEVKEITTQQGGLQTTLYRVRKEITTSYNINDNAEGEGDGQNEHTEFIISGSSTEQSVGKENVDTVVANYIEVSDNATLTVPEDKVLVVTNGLDVTDGATVDVQAGSTLIVGEGGVTSENVESIVIEANEQGSASFLLAPEVIVNTTPNITIKMTAKQIGYEMDGSERDFFWFRFAAPVADIQGFDKDKDRPTYIYKWDYAADDWASISALGEMEPFQGYTLTTNHEGLEDVTYTFKGRLAGNQDIPLQFKSRGFNFFGNSYTGYMDIHALVDQLMNHEAIDGTVYLWDQGAQSFYPTTLGDLADADSAEVAPMQTFILRQINTGEQISTTVNYASAIWGNPRYGLVDNNTPSLAPKRVNNDVTKMTIVVSAENGKTDRITFKESDEYSDEFNKGFDAVKFMNENQINLYATIDNENYGSVATDNIEGKLINIQTVKALNYTMSFKNVRSEEYAIRDNTTNKVIAIEEGATYEFAAQPNSTVEGRFEIVDRANVVTSIDNAQDNKANVKGIYTIMGQYVGENFDVLPTGVYVVDGVKIVK